jgi:hypothetical protein
MDEDFSLFPKLNPLPPAENARDPKTGPGKEFRRKKKEKKKALPGNKIASEGDDFAAEDPEQKKVGKVLDITV